MRSERLMLLHGAMGMFRAIDHDVTNLPKHCLLYTSDAADE